MHVACLGPKGQDGQCCREQAGMKEWHLQRSPRGPLDPTRCTISFVSFSAASTLRPGSIKAVRRLKMLLSFCSLQHS